MRITLRSGAKINLGLAIGPLRPDGFHALATVYQTLALEDGACDLVTVELLQGSSPRPALELTCSDPRVPLDSRNTVTKMLEAALSAPGRPGIRVRAHIEKRLPIQGGLGAGSANAAAGLVGLERLIARAGLAAPLTPEHRLRIAAAVGSDVPLFLLGGAVLGYGRGELAAPLPDLEPLHALVVMPQAGVSTPAAFREWDAQVAALGLTPQAQADRMDRLSRALAAAWCEPHTSGVFAAGGKDRAGTLLSTLVQTGILENDFEQVVFRQHPLLEQIKHGLAGTSSAYPAVYAALSGSGAALFGLYAQAEGVEAAQQRLSRMDVRTVRARLQPRPSFWGGMVHEEQ